VLAGSASKEHSYTQKLFVVWGHESFLSDCGRYEMYVHSYKTKSGLEAKESKASFSSNNGTWRRSDSLTVSRVPQREIAWFLRWSLLTKMRLKRRETHYSLEGAPTR
jgi:hypothetical protein